MNDGIFAFWSAAGLGARDRFLHFTDAEAEPVVTCGTCWLPPWPCIEPSGACSWPCSSWGAVFHSLQAGGQGKGGSRPRGPHLWCLCWTSYSTQADLKRQLVVQAAQQVSQAHGQVCTVTCPGRRGPAVPLSRGCTEGDVRVERTLPLGRAGPHLRLAAYYSQGQCGGCDSAPLCE